MLEWRRNGGRPLAFEFRFGCPKCDDVACVVVLHVGFEDDMASN